MLSTFNRDGTSHIVKVLKITTDYHFLRKVSP